MDQYLNNAINRSNSAAQLRDPDRPVPNLEYFNLDSQLLGVLFRSYNEHISICGFRQSSTGITFLSFFDGPFTPVERKRKFTESMVSRAMLLNDFKHSFIVSVMVSTYFSPSEGAHGCEYVTIPLAQYRLQQRHQKKSTGCGQSTMIVQYIAVLFDYFIEIQSLVHYFSTCFIVQARLYVF